MLVSEKVVSDHKNKMLEAFDDEGSLEETLTEVLLSLRVNAL